MWGLNEGLQAKKTKKVRAIKAAQEKVRERCEREARDELSKRRRIAEEPAIPRMEDLMFEFQVETR